MLIVSEALIDKVQALSIQPLRMWKCASLYRDFGIWEAFYFPIGIVPLSLILPGLCQGMCETGSKSSKMTLERKKTLMKQIRALDISQSRLMFELDVSGTEKVWVWHCDKGQ